MQLYVYKHGFMALFKLCLLSGKGADVFMYSGKMSVRWSDSGLMKDSSVYDLTTCLGFLTWISTHQVKNMVDMHCVWWQWSTDPVKS